MQIMQKIGNYAEKHNYAIDYVIMFSWSVKQCCINCNFVLRL